MLACPHFCILDSCLQCRCTNLFSSSIHGCVSRMFLHACTCLPVVRRKASTGSDTACSAHQLRLHDCDVKPNAVKAVTALHPKMSAHVHMVARPKKPKQTNQTAGQFQQTHVQRKKNTFNTTQKADRPSKHRPTGSLKSVATTNAFASACTQYIHACEHMRLIHLARLQT